MSTIEPQGSFRADIAAEQVKLGYRLSRIGLPSQVAAALIKPFVSAENHWIVEHHGLFQGYYWFHHYGIDRDTRDRHMGHPYYQATVDFCAKYDQNCFDPEYPTLPLEHFEPMVRELFARAPHDVFAE